MLKISDGNSKMGEIKSVSLPSVLTCRGDCECVNKCYARKLENLRPSVKAAYASNYELLLNDPDKYWEQINDALKMVRFFRFHVSGDIPDDQYLWHMIDVAIKNPHCEILCFTKRYDIVNKMMITLIAETGMRRPPENLHIIFSAWRGTVMENPFGFPEAHVEYKDGTTTARSDALRCTNNCTLCAKTDCGCWTLQFGQQVVFKEH